MQQRTADLHGTCTLILTIQNIMVENVDGILMGSPKRSQHSQGCKDPRRQCNVFVTRDLDLWPFEPRIIEFSLLVVQHFDVMFVDP